MNISLLKTFLEVARQRHFGRAADKICLTQSAVSARIKQLEELIGSPLFIRKKNDIKLTGAGHRLAISAAQMVNFWEQALNEINFVSDDEQKLIRVGFSFDLWSILFKRWLITQRHLHPNLFFQILALSAPLLSERLLADELDAIVVFDPPYHSGLEVSEVDTLDLDLILVSSEPVSLYALSNLNFYYVDWGTHFADQYQQLMADKLTPTMSFNISSMALDYMLEQGGLCYLSRLDAQAYMDHGQLYEVKDAPQFKRQIYFCYRKSNVNAPLLDSLASIK